MMESRGQCFGAAVENTDNMLAKDNGGSNYNVPLDQFSLDILMGTYEAAVLLIDEPVSELTQNLLQDADNGVWSSKGLRKLFPGNVQFADYKLHDNPEDAEAIFNTQGTIHSLMMGQEFLMKDSVIAGLGSRPAVFYNKPGFTTIEGVRFISVVNDCSGKIEVFWDKSIILDKRETPTVAQPVDITQIQNESVGDWVWNGVRGEGYFAARAVREYVQADFDHIPKFNRNFERSNKYLDLIRERLANSIAPILKKGEFIDEMVNKTPVLRGPVNYFNEANTSDFVKKLFWFLRDE